jgi:ribonuclease Z
MIRVILLGTSAARPTIRRNVSGLAIQREGDLMLFDCGEGTQRQMMRFNTGFGVGEVYFTHMHADHFLGITGLLRTMALQGRTDPLRLFGPKGSEPVIRTAVKLGVERVPFEICVEERQPGQAVKKDGYSVVPFNVRHGTQAVGWALIEDERLGRFDVERARALGVPEGPLFGRLHRGQPVEVNGRTVTPEEVVGPSRPGRKVVYTGDTSPASGTVAMARGADLLIHDATFSVEEEQRARDTHHTTARGAASVAREAGAKRLVLTHLSARYADDPAVLEREARSVFAGAKVAHDGMVVEIPYPPDEPEPPAEADA